MNSCPRCNHASYQEDIFCGHCGLNLLSHKQDNSATMKELKLSDVQLSLGIIYFKKGELNKASDTFNKILSFDPNNAHAKRLMKQINLMSGFRPGGAENIGN